MRVAAKTQKIKAVFVGAGNIASHIVDYGARFE